MAKRKTSPAAAPARSRFVSIAAVAIVIAGLAVYANSLSGPFVFDDYRAIVQNATIRTISLTTLLHPQQQTPVAGRPLPNLSLALNYAVDGQNVTTYHLFNVAVHILAALVLLGVLRRTPVWPTADPGDAGDAGDDDTRNRVALFVALAWLLHPLNTDAVDYITQRTESMAGLFFLLTLYAAIRAWRDTGRRWTAAAIAACWFGVASKEIVVTVPIVVLLWDRTFECPSFADAFRRRGRLYAGLGASWLLFLLLSLDTPFFSPTGFETSVSRWTYLLNQAPLIVRYLRLSFWPVGLVFDYGMPQALTLSAVWPSVLAIVAVLVLATVAVIRRTTLGFWGAWFFVTLAPASSVLPIPSEVGAERRMYLPLVAVLVVAVSLGRWALTSAPPVWSRRVAPALGLAALVALGGVTMIRNTEYATGLSIWETVIARYPHARAHENLAIQLRDAGRVDESIDHLRVAAPDLPDAKHALGSALLERGDLAGGITELEAFVRANPRDREIASARAELASARVRFASGLLQQQRFREAEVEAQRLILENPDKAGEPSRVVAFNLLGVALASEDRIEEAIDAFRSAVQIDPQAKEPRDNLDRALGLLSGRTPGNR